MIAWLRPWKKMVHAIVLEDLSSAKGIFVLDGLTGRKYDCF